VQAASKLRANEEMSFQGPILVGEGFRLALKDLGEIGIDTDALPPVVRPYILGRDIVQRREERYAIDFFGFTEKEAQAQYPDLYQRLLTRVKPERDSNRDRGFRENWWLWGRPRPGLREATRGLPRMIVTNFAAKHRVFVFELPEVVIDHNAYVITTADAFHLGVLSSSAHITWMLAAGSTLEDRPLWVNSTCFLPFPFPAGADTQIARIRERGEALDAHRRHRQSLHPSLTLTAMYNVLEKLRAGEPLNAKDKAIHEQGLVSTLKQIHDDLDAAVFDAYGWSSDLTDEQILERLVALNAERAEEEQNGVVRWLRPEFQNPQGEQKGQRVLVEAGGKKAAKGKTAKVQPAVWPKYLPARIGAVRATIESRRGGLSVDDVASTFKGARRTDVESILESLFRLGLARSYREGNSTLWSAVQIA
jgi:hypothetical protein